jgi:chemotaxis response regulator CheB
VIDFRPGLSVAYIDDNAADRLLMREWLEGTGVSVYLFKGVEEASQWLRTHAVDIILLDYRLGAYTADEVMHQIPVGLARLILVSDDLRAKAIGPEHITKNHLFRLVGAFGSEVTITNDSGLHAQLKSVIQKIERRWQ